MPRTRNLKHKNNNKGNLNKSMHATQIRIFVGKMHFAGYAKNINRMDGRLRYIIIP